MGQWTREGQWSEENTGGGVMADVRVLDSGAVVVVTDGEGVGVYRDAAHWHGEDVGPWGDGQPVAWWDVLPIGNDAAPTLDAMRTAAATAVLDADDAVRLSARARLTPDALTLDAAAPSVVYAMGRAALGAPVTATLRSGYVTLTRR